MFQVMRKYQCGPAFRNAQFATEFVGRMREGDLPGCSYTYEIEGSESWRVYRHHPVFPARANLRHCVEDMDLVGGMGYAADSEFYVASVCATANESVNPAGPGHQAGFDEWRNSWDGMTDRELAA